MIDLASSYCIAWLEAEADASSNASIEFRQCDGGECRTLGSNPGVSEGKSLSLVYFH